MDVEILPNFKMHKNGNGGGKHRRLLMAKVYLKINLASCRFSALALCSIALNYTYFLCSVGVT